MSASVLRIIVLVHRWLGIVFGLLFLAWFASGIVMIYARMPELPAGELARRAQPLDPESIRISPATAATHLPCAPNRFRLTTLQSRPLYRLVSGCNIRVNTAVFADTGELLQPLDATAAVFLVRSLVPEFDMTIRHDARLTDADQWTMGVRAQMPMHRVAVGDAADTYFYVAENTGEVVMRTTANARRWAYPGAVLHWLYFAPFRRQAALWNQSIVWLSSIGCVMCLAGLVWGVSVIRKSPYSGLMKWHHYSGLIFGAATLTWVFSGLLSMGPFIGPGSAPARAERERVAGGAIDIINVTTESLRAAIATLAASAPDRRLTEIEAQPFQGQLYLFGGGHIVSAAHPAHGAFDRFPDDVIERVARDAMPGVTVEDAAWLNDYDSYYYARDGALSLPVYRIRFADPNRTWLYVDPRRGTLVRKEERRSRIERWLYHGLHSLDFPFLYNRRPLWDVVMIVLSIGGIVLSATTLLPGWRRLRRHSRAMFKRAT